MFISELNFKLCDDLYKRGYEDGRGECNYDPRGCEEWERVESRLPRAVDDELVQKAWEAFNSRNPDGTPRSAFDSMRAALEAVWPLQPDNQVERP